MLYYKTKSSINQNDKPMKLTTEEIGQIQKKGLHVSHSFDYDKFNMLMENRTIDHKRVHKLRKSVESYSTLRPLIVAILNNKMYIADGQHLFLCLRLMQYPIPYTTVHINTKLELLRLIITLNSTAKVWSLRDYVNCWSIFGLKPYTILHSYLVRFGYGVTEMAIIMSGDLTCKNPAIIKNGEFTINLPESEILQTLKYLDDIFDLMPSVTKLQRAQLATSFVRYFRLCKEYNHKKTLQIIKDNMEVFSLLAESSQFYEFFTKRMS